MPRPRLFAAAMVTLSLIAAGHAEARSRRAPASPAPACHNGARVSMFYSTEHAAQPLRTSGNAACAPGARTFRT